ncbi:MAG TPA: hypothetical protein VK176_00535 [Phycisphaerales bacterium]|nr:hypothetical protein [Phycisphaerales bacterium]
MGTLGLIWRIATGPVWILWSGYKGLWWVFGDTHEPAAKASGKAPADPAQDASFQVVDSGPRPLPTPVRALRGGFVGSLMASGGLLLATNAMAASQVMEPGRAVVSWLWGSAIIAVTSIFMVRRAVRLDRQRQGLKSVIRGARDMAQKAAVACTWATQAAVKRAAGSVAGCARAGVDKAGELNQRHGIADRARSRAGAALSSLRRLWASVGRGTSQTRSAA